MKTTGESLPENEMASAWDPKVLNFQIVVATTSKFGVPTCSKLSFRGQARLGLSYFDGANGKSEFQVSTMHFHFPSLCFFQISMFLP